MKKLLLPALFGLGIASAQAQSIPAGTISLGGNIGYSRTSSESTGTTGNTTFTAEGSTSQFSFTPSVGYFVADNLALGLMLGYSAYSKPYFTYTPAPSSARAQLDPTTTLRLGLYAQYYKMLSEQFGFVGTLGGGFQSVREYDYTGSGSNTISESKGSGYYAGLTPGIVFFPIPKLGLTASIGSLAFDHVGYDYPTNAGTAPSNYKNTLSTFGANFGLSQLQFGGTWYFGR